MTDKLIAEAVKTAIARAAMNPSTSLKPRDAPAVAREVAAALPTPAALEPLWPQLARYAITIAGTAVASKGWVSAEDWTALSGALLAAAPIVWRVGATLLARRSAQA